jgi:hypothetical protein
MSASFRLTNADEILRNMERKGDNARRAVRSEFIKIGREIAIDARNNHRFQNRTGQLQNSIEGTVSQDGLTLTMEAGRKLAQNYAEPTHEGHGTWAPDPFLENAFNRAKPKMGDRLTSAISKAIGAK